ncbi:NAD(P)/FAD-dependent oxidoreductase [Streptomyces sp. NPDC002088]|uniref:phytoene desaturase family protein n=1 Tax=Streptomyces sp. NPDC002088 TaxID=3154665 RepID=UPI003331CC1C
MTTAIVVGSGPNGLAAAVTLAHAGIRVRVLEAAPTIGGGTRSGEYTLPGLLHDECSGFHPLAVDSAFARAFDLEPYGLRWRWPEVQYAHPLDEGRGAAAWRSVEETARNLGQDGAAWHRLFGPLAEHFGAITEDFTKPILHLPQHPVKLAKFGLRAGMPATLLAQRWSTAEARALFAGVAAHSFRPLGSLASSAIGVALGTAAHAYGWPVAEGGSAAITTAMAALLAKHGGSIETNTTVSSLHQLAGADIIMLDTSPRAAAQIMGQRLPRRVARAYRRYRHGPAAYQVAFAVEGGIPWLYEPARRAGTVHLGGTVDELAAAEKEVWRGTMPQRPFVLLGQQYLADPSRAADGVVPIDAYAHVPANWNGDATEAIESQIERYAPGFRARIVARHIRSVAAVEVHNANYVGGDIVTGANQPLQLVFRPRIALDPYFTGVDGVFLCSAATPPGAGAHGLCGYRAAQSALRRHGLR